MSFVVSSSGGVEGGGSKEVVNMFNNVVDWTAPGFLIKLNTTFGLKTGTKPTQIVVSVIIVMLIIIVWSLIFSGVALWAGAGPPLDKFGNSRKIPWGGVMGPGGTRLAGHVGLDGRSGMIGPDHSRMDTFLGEGARYQYNMPPNYVMRKENNRNTAINSYAALKASGKAVPDWAEYWNTYQSNNNLSYGGQQMWDTNDKSIHDIEVVNGKNVLIGTGDPTSWSTKTSHADGSRSFAHDIY
jgi:hypothetical protein